MTTFRHIGKKAPRPDAPDKAAGRALYIHDLKRPGMLFGKIKFSDQAHARTTHIDTSKAERLPGVKAVITAENTPEIRFGFLRDNLALKKGKVRQFRDEVAAEAAIDPEIAQEAVDLITAEYEPLPGVFSIQEAVVDAEYSTPLVQQACMGTAGCIAEFGMNRNLTIWAKTQIPFLAQRDFNRALADLGLSGKNTRVIVPTLGGGFGTGLDTHAYEYIAILLAFQTGHPVKILYTRDEEFAFLSPRQSSETRISQGCNADGRLTFREVEVLQDNGAYTSWGATYPTVMMMPATSLYRVPNVRFNATLVYTNNTFCQAMRGYGNPEHTWALESSMDELAEELFPAEVEKNLAKHKEKNPGFVPPEIDIQKLAKRGLFELQDGVLFFKDGPTEPWLRLDPGRLLRAAHFRCQGQMLAAEVFYDPPNELPDFAKGYGNISATYAFGAQGAEVEVDTGTGEVKILRMVAAHDVGKVLNPLALKGQVYGALAQGIGYALYEKLESDKGRIQNTNFRDYKIPTIQEMDFPIEVEFIETMDEFGPFGAKGVAEPGLVPTAPAIANAVYDAIGVRIRDLPITPEKILAALRTLNPSKE